MQLQCPAKTLLLAWGVPGTKTALKLNWGVWNSFVYCGVFLGIEVPPTSAGDFSHFSYQVLQYNSINHKTGGGKQYMMKTYRTVLDKTFIILLNSCGFGANDFSKIQTLFPGKSSRHKRIFWLRELETMVKKLILHWQLSTKMSNERACGLQSIRNTGPGKFIAHSCLCF